MMKKNFVVDSQFSQNGKILKYCFALVIALFAYTSSIFAGDNNLPGAPQQIIKGYVFDSDGNPLPGATIRVKNNPSAGTATDNQGYFALDVAVGTELTVSFIGYETLTVFAEDNMKITLSESVNSMNDIVVIGYGKVKKSDLTGSVSSISAKSIVEQSRSTGAHILQGRAAGVYLTTTNGAPGKGSTIRIRGANSLYGGNDPLVVVDGSPGGIPDINDIESLEILKDASATAIYGSRGANGVIIVKTKNGSIGKPRLSIFADATIDKMPEYYNLMDAYEFAEFNNRVGTYSFTDEELADYFENGGTDWQKAITRTGYTKHVKATLQGGSEDVQYYVTGYYNNTKGIFKNVDNEGYEIDSKIGINVSRNVYLELKAEGAQSNNTNPDLLTGGSKTSLPLMAAMVWSPTEDIYESDGSFNRLGIGTGAIINPLLMTTVQKTGWTNWGAGSAILRIKIIEGLEFDAKAKVNYSNSGNRNFASAEYSGVNASASQTSNDYKSWLLNGYLTYTKTLAGVHNLSLMGGFEETQDRNIYFSASADDLPLESVTWNDLGLASPNVSVSSGYANSAMRSFFGRVNYNYASRYFLTVNYRADGSSKFKGSNQWGYFPSFSLAWKLSEEEFMKNQDIFQNVKIRGGWGVIGNQAIGTYATYTTLGNRAWSWGTSTAYAGYFARVGGNENLKWESTKQSNIGLDFSILKGRIDVALDAYDKKTVDLLAPISVSGYNGGDSEYGSSTVISNVGSVRNKGFEYTVNIAVIKTKVFAYSITATGAINRNEVLSLGESSIIYGDTYAAGLTSVSPFVLMPGESIGAIYGLKYLGIWQANEAEEAALFGQVPGDYKYEDVNENYSYDSGDKQIIGNTNPSFCWGIVNHFTYKNFDLDILLQGIEGRDVMNWSYMVGAEKGTVAAFYTLKEAKNRWTPSNPNAEFARVGTTNGMQPLSSQYMQDGSYVKLRNVSLTYHMPEETLSFARLTFSVSAQNMLTFTKYKGLDPEISSSEGDDISAGMDWFAYPNAKSISFGISIEY